MKKLILPLLAIALLIPLAAHADTIIVPNTGAGNTVQKLPGNAQIVTGPGNPTVVIRNDDESLLYRTLVAPNARDNYYQPNTASLNDVNSICGTESNISKKNKCIADVLKEREKLQRRYND